MARRPPETPLGKFARMFGGVVLLNGRLGHEVLGQMLVTNFSQSELAGAALVSAAGSRQRRVFVQAAVNTAAPAVALQALVNQADTRLTRREQAVSQRELEVAKREAELDARERELVLRGANDGKDGQAP